MCFYVFVCLFLFVVVIVVVVVVVVVVVKKKDSLKVYSRRIMKPMCHISQGHNLCKFKYISFEEVKILYFQQLFHS